MFDAHLAYRARQHPRATAVITAKRQVSYAQFDDDVTRLGAALLDMDLAPGLVLALALSHVYLQIVGQFACARVGIVSAPGNDPGADVVLTDAPERGAPPDRATIRITRDWIDGVLAAEPRPLRRPDLDPDSLGRVMLSSGTTRVPRRIPFTWRRLEAGIQAHILAYAHGKTGTWIPLTGPDSMTGHSQTLAGIAVGASIYNGMAVQELPPWLETAEPGIVSMTPAQLRRLLALLPADFAAKPGWRLTTSGSALPPDVAREARLRITPDIHIIYGATEAGISASGHARELETAPDFVGYPTAGATLEIVDERDQAVPPGELGELRVKGVRKVVGYLDDPEATTERFRDGWFYTNDLCRLLPDGRLTMEGRADDRMNLGGVKFMPQILENAAFACAGVVDCAAFAVPDAQGLDQCWLAVTAAADFDRDSLTLHLARWGDLPPLRVAWIEEIPRNAMGKVERGKLRAAVLAATAR